MPIPGLAGMKLKNIYTVSSITQETAEIDLSGNVKLKDQEIVAEGQTAIANLKGTRNGIYAIDLSTGLINTSSITFEMDGNISVMGQELPIEIQSTATVKKK